MHNLLAVRVWAPGGDHHVDVEDLTFTKTAPGGHAHAGFRLPAWVTASDPALAPLARVKIYDTRTGDTVWGAGYLDMPGKTVDAGGHSWDVGAIGPTSLLTDRALGYIGVDRSLGNWRRSFATDQRMTAEAATDPVNEAVDGLVLFWPQGIPVGTGGRVVMRHDLLAATGQKIGGVQITHHEGTPGTSVQFELLASADTGPNDLIRARDWVTADETINNTTAGPLGTTHSRASVRIRRAGAALNIASEVYYAVVTDVAIQALRLLQDGTNDVGPASYQGTVQAHQVLADALHRFTSLIDIPGAAISAGSYAIDQLAYPDPVHLPDILGDLELFEPDLYHYVGASDDTTNLHAFSYRSWGADPRYEADTSDGWSEPGGQVDLCNRVTVAWIDKAGRPQSTVATAVVPALDALGRLRDAEPVEIGYELGSPAAATRIGERVLAEQNNPPRSGTLTVARPIRDLTTGRLVAPHEIAPGYLVRVRDLDLITRLSETTYRSSDQSATLTLGRPVLTRDQLLLRRQRNRRRR